MTPDAAPPIPPDAALPATQNTTPPTPQDAAPPIPQDATPAAPLDAAPSDPQGAAAVPVARAGRGAVLAGRRWSGGQLAAAVSGLVLVGAPALASPGWVYPVAVAGGIAAVVAAARRWAGVGTLTVVSAVAECAGSRLDVTALAGEGLLLLAFLLLLDAPAGMAGPAASRWLRLQVPAALAGLTGATLVLVSLALTPAASTWLVVTGLAAAVTAYLIALPRAGRPTSK